ncbi:MAG TPA: ArdC-like ssDNA-binding domain-containing protein [Cellulomonas sp.]
MRSNLPPSTEENLTALHTQLVDAVAELRQSDKWAQMLAVAARFTTYSPSNVLLIAVQRPDATQVAGIRTWNSLGRHVVKGEHGIAILAPCLYRADDEPAAAADGAPAAESADDGPMPRRELRGFRVVHVFDVAQTDGTPLPDAAPQLLTGDAPRDVWDGLVGLTLKAGYRLDRQTCPAGINGWTAPEDKVVVIDKNLEAAQATKTLAHELGHIRANHHGRFPDYATDRRCRGAAEVEAESIAYMVTSHLGMNPAAYSVPYVAGWADDLDVLRHHMSTVVTSSQWILGDLEEQTSTGARAAVLPARPVALQYGGHPKLPSVSTDLTRAGQGCRTVGTDA